MLYDIINEQQNITLPVVAVNVTGITRDNNRVFNKLDGFYLPLKDQTKGANFTKVRTPTPVNINISMSIVGKFQSDIDQIISNFVPYNNPYIIISWKLPPQAGLGYDAEIRSEVLWDGTVTLTPPTDLTSSSKYNIVAETTFTIKGWLFKQFDDVANIFVVDYSFTPVNTSDTLGYNSYYTLSGENFYTTDYFSVSGIPQIHSIYAGLSNSNLQTHITESTSIVNQLSNIQFTLQGEWFSSLTNILLSSNNLSLFPNLTSINTIKQGTITGSNITNYTVLTDSILTFTLPPTQQSGNFAIITVNEVGWDSSSMKQNIVFTMN